jgi:peptidoglycan/LPS O-acetylase OafA/YrhL
VLTYNYIAPDGRLGASSARFFVARFARIYPVYLLALVLFIPNALFTRAVPAEQWTATLWSSITLTQSWTELIYWNRPGWTVSTEVFFYLAFPLLAPVLCRLRRGQLLAAVAVLWLLAQVPVIVYQALAPSDALWLRIVKHNPLARLPEFLIGVAIGQLVLADSARAARARTSVWVGCLVVALIGLALAVIAVPTGGWYLAWHNGLLAPLFALLIYGLARGDATISRLPGMATLTQLGEASYGIYILQTPIHALCMAFVSFAVLGKLAVADASVHSPLFVAGYVGVLIGCSLLCLRWYETPARAAIRRLMSPGEARRRDLRVAA